MNLREAQGHISEAEVAVSTAVRQLALGGIAVFWVLAGGSTRAPSADWVLLAAGAGLVAALACDFTQYAYTAARWRCWVDGKVRAGQSDPQADIEDGPLRGARLLWWGKCVLLLVGYAFLLVAFVGTGFLD
ncbi:hypothetical protein [Streptomyces sp. NPDC021622]|uniref:hypothetical protein n=1 Tax=Streptomyces sp. NPDC021622 TaxID=3155013 RepID=UPI0033EEFBA7